MCSSPPKPLLLYDAQCALCGRWVERSRRRTGDQVQYRPAAEPHPASVRLIATDGSVSTGAAAIFRLRGGVWQWLYERLPGFAPLSEWGYRIVTRHRHRLAKR